MADDGIAPAGPKQSNEQEQRATGEQRRQGSAMVVDQQQQQKRSPASSWMRAEILLPVVLGAFVLQVWVLDLVQYNNPLRLLRA